MRQLILFILAVVLSSGSFAQKQENHSRVKVLLDMREHNMMKLAATGVAVDHGDYRKGEYFISDFSDSEIKAIQDAGFKTEILIKDVAKYYEEQVTKKNESHEKMTSVPCDTIGIPDVKVPQNFNLGSYAGGHFTYTEMLQVLDQMRQLYPNLISVKQPIGSFTTIENRPIYWLRISNNPDVAQPLKPQMLYTAMHHAREPGSLTATIFYMWYLLENYGTDPVVTSIVNNTELYFVPCVNPDGFIYNLTIAPNGGGMWRKNRRNNGNGTFGVDLNRNYGYLWGYDNTGSSPFGGNETYRGPSAFSEVETQAIKWFTEQHQFKIAMNYHTYNNELLSPFGHVPVAYPDDSLEFSAMSVELTKYNFYRYGTCYQCLGYVANGGSDDWMYAEQSTKPKIYAFTPEIGEVSNGFYPPSSQILPDCKRNLLANVNVAALLVPYAKINSADPNIITQTSGYIHYNIQRLGLSDTGKYTVTATPLDNWISIPSPFFKQHIGLGMLQNLTDSIPYTLHPNITNNQAVKFVLKVNNGHYDITDTVEFFYGKFTKIIKPSMDNMNDWMHTGWSVNTTHYHTAPASFKSSPDNGYYPNNAFATVRMKNKVDLKNTLRAYLQYYAKWDIEPKYDWVLVNAIETGAGSTALCGKYTKPGEYGQPTNAPIYDDHQYDWFLEQMDLTGYAGKEVDIQFTLETDAGATYDGFYFDDFQVIAIIDSPNHIAELGAEQFKVYPNPAQDRFTIIMQQPDNTVATLTDAMGRIVKEIKISTQQTSVDIASLSSGIYYLKIVNSDAVLPVQKIEVLR